MILINPYLFHQVEIETILLMKLEKLFTPLFFEHNFRKVSEIFSTKNSSFSINNKKKFFKFLSQSYQPIGLSLYSVDLY